MEIKKFYFGDRIYLLLKGYKVLRQLKKATKYRKCIDGLVKDSLLS